MGIFDVFRGDKKSCDGETRESVGSADNSHESEGFVETTQIMEVTIHSINEITRETDVVGKVDPYVVVYANSQLIGKTTPLQDTTSAVLNQQFIIKAKDGVDPQSIKFKFDLIDQDTFTSDDAIGSGQFNPMEEEIMKNQVIHLKYNGSDVGSITVSITMKDIILVA